MSQFHSKTFLEPSLQMWQKDPLTVIELTVRMEQNGWVINPANREAEKIIHKLDALNKMQ